MTAINELRKNENLTVDEMAKALGISFSYAYKLCYGGKTPSARVLKEIHRAFPHVEIEEYLYG